MTDKIPCRTLVLSDLHLGTHRSRPELILNVLRTYQPERLILNGDILDLWAMRRNLYFPTSHWNVVRKIIKMSKDTPVYYVCGNHDSVIGDIATQLEVEDTGNIIFCERVVLDTCLGRTLILHGHQFDTFISRWKSLAVLADIIYHGIVRFQRWIHRKGYNLPAVDRLIKRKVKKLVIPQFKQRCSGEAQKHDCQAVIAGHVHNPEICDLDGVDYLNSGDFCESNSFLIEDYDSCFNVRYSLGDADVG